MYSAQEERGARDRQMIHLMPTAVTYSKYENLLSIWILAHLGARLAELYPPLRVYFFFPSLAGISQDGLAWNASFSEVRKALCR